ncbi:MAG: PrsW family intramembrane metalloprotease [Chloroflexi bacterium]|nr:PrsW family intramembrane metalloprotease [Chloroflexota bacterium]
MVRIVLSFINHRWLQVLIIGVILFVVTEQALKITGNPNFFPTVIMIGSFSAPLAFVTYMYERERRQDIEKHPVSPVASVAACFLIGGVIGVTVAGVIEYATLRGLSTVGLLGVGFIEEAAKLIFPIAIFLRGTYRSDIDGIVFGVASGMGFASLETMGYGLVSFIVSSGDFNVLDQVLLVRGLISPVGHAAWTGLICAVLWRERTRKGHAVLNLLVVGTFVFVVGLHALWNLSNGLAGHTTGSLIVAMIGNIAVAGTSSTLLMRRMWQSSRLSLEAAA